MNPEIPRRLKKDVIMTPDDKRKAFQDLGFEKEETLQFLKKHFKIKTLEEKIEELKKAGLKNPIKAIEKHPPLAGLDIEKVKRRIRALERLIKFYSLKGISGPDIGEKNPPLFDYNIHRIYFYWKLLRKSSPEISSSEELIKKVNLLTKNNPYLVFSYLKERRPENFLGIRQIVGEITSRGPLKPDKEKIIKETKENLPKLIEKLKESPQPYDKFLLSLAQTLELRLRKEKEEEKRREEKEEH